MNIQPNITPMEIPVCVSWLLACLQMSVLFPAYSYNLSSVIDENICSL